MNAYSIFPEYNPVIVQTHNTAHRKLLAAICPECLPFTQIHNKVPWKLHEYYSTDPLRNHTTILLKIVIDSAWILPDITKTLGPKILQPNITWKLLNTTQYYPIWPENYSITHNTASMLSEYDLSTTAKLGHYSHRAEALRSCLVIVPRVFCITTLEVQKKLLFTLIP